MALEKLKKLRQIEIIFTDDQIHPTAHCLYNIIIEEDGKEISRSNHRENMKFEEVKALLESSQVYVYPED